MINPYFILYDVAFHTILLLLRPNIIGRSQYLISGLIQVSGYGHL